MYKIIKKLYKIRKAVASICLFIFVFQLSTSSFAEMVIDDIPDGYGQQENASYYQPIQYGSDFSTMQNYYNYETYMAAVYTGLIWDTASADLWKQYISDPTIFGCNSFDCSTSDSQGFLDQLESLRARQNTIENTMDRITTRNQEIISNLFTTNYWKDAAQDAWAALTEVDNYIEAVKDISMYNTVEKISAQTERIANGQTGSVKSEAITFLSSVSEMLLCMTGMGKIGQAAMPKSGWAAAVTNFFGMAPTSFMEKEAFNNLAVNIMKNSEQILASCTQNKWLIDQVSGQINKEIMEKSGQFIKDGVVDSAKVKEALGNIYGSWNEAYQGILGKDFAERLDPKITQSLQDGFLLGQTDLKWYVKETDLLNSMAGGVEQYSKLIYSYKMQKETGSEITKDFAQAQRELYIRDFKIQMGKIEAENFMTISQAGFLREIQDARALYYDMENKIVSGIARPSDYDLFNSKIASIFDYTRMKRLTDEIKFRLSPEDFEKYLKEDTIFSYQNGSLIISLKPINSSQLGEFLSRINRLENGLIDVAKKINTYQIKDTSTIALFNQAKDRLEAKIKLGTATETDFKEFNNIISQLGYVNQYSKSTDIALLNQERKELIKKAEIEMADKPEDLEVIKASLDARFNDMSGCTKILKNGDELWVKEYPQPKDKDGYFSGWTKIHTDDEKFWMNEKNVFVQEIIYPNGDMVKNITNKPLTADGGRLFRQTFPGKTIDLGHLKEALYEYHIGSLDSTASEETIKAAQLRFEADWKKLQDDVQATSTVWDKIYQFQNMAMLINPKTALRNMCENVAFSILQTTSKITSIPIDYLYSKIFGTAQRTVVAPSIMANIYGIKDGAIGVFRDFMTGTMDEAAKYNLKQTFENKFGRAAERFLQLAVTDKIFYQRAFFEQLDGEMRLLVENGKYGSMEEVLAKLTTEDSDIILKRAIEYAEECTLANVTKFTQAFTGFKNVLNGGKLIRVQTAEGIKWTVTEGNGLLIPGLKLGEFVIKYAKIPANMLQQTLKYSPAGLLQVINDFGRILIRDNGTIRTSAERLAMASELQGKIVAELSKVAVGSSIIYFGILMYNKGMIIPGEMLSNFKDKLLAQSYGIKDYGFNVDMYMRWVMSGFDDTALVWKERDLVIKIDVGMAGNLIALGSDAGYLAKKGDILNLVIGMCTTLTDHSILNNIVDNFFIRDTWKVLTQMDRSNLNIGQAFLLGIMMYLGDMTTTFIPQFVGSLRAHEDNLLRIVNSDDPWQIFLNKIYNKLPWMSDKLKPMTVDGKNVLKYPEDLRTDFNIFANPFYYDHYSGSKVTTELLRIWDKTGYKEGLTVLKISNIYKNYERIIDGKPQEIYLPDYMKRSAEKYIATLFDMEMQKLFSSYEYLSASDTGKRDLIDIKIQGIKEQLSRKVARDYQLEMSNTNDEQQLKIRAVLNSNLPDDEKQRIIQETLKENITLKNMINGKTGYELAQNRTDWGDKALKLLGKDPTQWTQAERETAGQILKGEELIKAMQDQASTMLDNKYKMKLVEQEKELKASISTAKKELVDRLNNLDAELEVLKKQTNTFENASRIQEIYSEKNKIYKQLRDITAEILLDAGRDEEALKDSMRVKTLFPGTEEKTRQMQTALEILKKSKANALAQEEQIRENLSLLPEERQQKIDELEAKIRGYDKSITSINFNLENKSSGAASFLKKVQERNDPLIEKSNLAKCNSGKCSASAWRIMLQNGDVSYSDPYADVKRAVNRDLREAEKINLGSAPKSFNNYQQKLDLLDKTYVYESPNKNEFGVSKLIASLNPYYSYIQLCNVLSQAQESIDLAVYNFRRDDGGLNSDVYEALIKVKRARPNVKIRAVTDDETESEFELIYDPAKDAFTNLKNMGYVDELAYVNANAIMHNKFFVVDKKLVVTGSMNLTEGSIALNNEINGSPIYNGHINSVYFITDSQIARTFTEVMEELLNGTRNSPVTTHDWKIRMDTNNAYVVENTKIQPYFTPYLFWYKPSTYYIKDLNECRTYKNAMNIAIQHLRAAQKRIRIFAFAFADVVLFNELMNASVPIEIFIESKQYATLEASNPGATIMLRKLASQKNVTVKLHSADKLLHTKTIIIDDHLVISGSMNFSNNAVQTNDENTVVFDSAPIAKIFQRFSDNFGVSRKGNIYINYPFRNSLVHMFKDLVEKTITPNADGSDSVEVGEGGVTQEEIEQIRNKKTPPDLQYVVVEKSYFNENFDQSMGIPFYANQREIMRTVKYDQIKTIHISYDKKKEGAYRGWHRYHEYFDVTSVDSAVAKYLELFNKVAGKPYYQMLYDYYNELAIKNNNPSIRIDLVTAQEQANYVLRSIIYALKGTEINSGYAVAKYEAEKRKFVKYANLTGIAAGGALLASLLALAGLTVVYGGTTLGVSIAFGTGTTIAAGGAAAGFAAAGLVLLTTAAVLITWAYYTPEDLYRKLTMETTFETKEEVQKRTQNDYREQFGKWQTFMIQSNWVINEEKEQFIKLQQDGLSGIDDYYLGEIYDMSDVERYASQRIKRAKIGKLLFAPNVMIKEDLYTSNGWNKADYIPMNQSFSTNADLEAARANFSKYGININKLYISKNFKLQNYEIKYTKVIDGKLCGQDKFDGATCNVYSDNYTANEYNQAVFKSLLMKKVYTETDSASAYYGQVRTYLDVKTNGDFGFKISEAPVVNVPNEIGVIVNPKTFTIPKLEGSYDYKIFYFYSNWETGQYSFKGWITDFQVINNNVVEIKEVLPTLSSNSENYYFYIMRKKSTDLTYKENLPNYGRTDINNELSNKCGSYQTCNGDQDCIKKIQTCYNDVYTTYVNIYGRELNISAPPIFVNYAFQLSIPQEMPLSNYQNEYFETGNIINEPENIQYPITFNYSLSKTGAACGSWGCTDVYFSGNVDLTINFPERTFNYSYSANSENSVRFYCNTGGPCFLSGTAKNVNLFGFNTDIHFWGPPSNQDYHWWREKASSVSGTINGTTYLSGSLILSPDPKIKLHFSYNKSQEKVSIFLENPVSYTEYINNHTWQAWSPLGVKLIFSGNDFTFLFNSIFSKLWSGTYGTETTEPDWMTRFKNNLPYIIGQSEIYFLFTGGNYNNFYPTKIFYDTIQNTYFSNQDAYNYVQAFIKNATSNVYASFDSDFYKDSVIEALKAVPEEKRKVFWNPTGDAAKDSIIKTITGVKKSGFHTNLIMSDNVLILITDDGKIDSKGMILIIKNPTTDVWNAAKRVFEQNTGAY